LLGINIGQDDFYHIFIKSIVFSTYFLFYLLLYFSVCTQMTTKTPGASVTIGPPTALKELQS